MLSRGARPSPNQETLLEEFRRGTGQELEVLEDAARALVEERLGDDLRGSARMMAHRMAGSLGSFGYRAGSALALHLSEMLSRAELGRSDAPRVARLVEDLRRELERPPVLDMPAAEAEGQPRLVVVASDEEFVQGLRQEALVRGTRVQVQESFAEAVRLLDEEPPQGFLADLPDAESLREGLALLAARPARRADCPIALISESDSQVDRLRAVRVGVRSFLSRLLPPRLVAEAILELMEREVQAPPRLLVIQPDREEFAWLRSVLDRDPVELLLLEDPDALWDTLKALEPDAVLVEADLQGGRGLDLCRMIRQEPRWWSLPVICLTRRSDPENVRHLFEAGADDCVFRPTAGAILLPCLRNRLERNRLVRRMAETDPFTGVASRDQSLDVLKRYLKLAHRHGKSITLALLEVEGFGELRATLGEEAGDLALRSLGALLVRTFRGEDVVARWSGERFAVVLYGCARDQAAERFQEVQRALDRREFRGPNGEAFRVRLRVGLAEHPLDGEEAASLQEAASAALAGQSQGISPPVGEVRRVDVVLVDDDEVLANLLLHALQDRGYRTEWYSDGLAAAEDLGGAHPRVRGRLILLDVDLPGLSGLQVLKRLSEGGVLRRSRVLMVTVRAVESEILEALGMGALDHIAKPFSLPVLLQRVERALAR